MDLWERTVGHCGYGHAAPHRLRRLYRHGIQLRTIVPRAVAEKDQLMTRQNRLPRYSILALLPCISSTTFAAAGITAEHSR